MTMLDDGFARMTTETADPRFDGIDRMTVAELAATMNEADATVPLAVGRALPSIVPAIEAVSDRMAQGGRLVYVGAGTPGRIAILDASECPPTFSTPPELVFAIMAGGAEAMVTPTEGAEDDAEAGRAAVDAARIGPGDSVVGIASSGRTPFVVAALVRARERGALTVGLSCNEGTPLSEVVEHPIEIGVGPEIITGSTRLKAGTAQKLVLNMFSTIAMVRQGKTYGNLMVDLKPTNSKLRERAARMVARIGGTDLDSARHALESTDYDVKVAAVMLRLGIDIEPARRRLDAAGGRLRAALGED